MVVEVEAIKQNNSNSKNREYTASVTDEPVCIFDKNTPPKYAETDNSLFSVVKAIPTFRRIYSAPDEVEKGNITTAAGMASLALINVPEDFRDMKNAYSQLKSAIKGGKYEYKYDYTKYQHPFSFLRGTLLNDVADSNKAKHKELAKKILKGDVTLARTRFGKKVFKILGVECVDKVETKVHDFGSTKATPKFVKANVYEGSSFGKLTAHAFERTTKYGVLAMALLELPKIVKAFNNGDNVEEKIKNGSKQILKSGINVAAITAGIGYAGAIGAQKLGPVGSLVGMGAGAIIGGYGSKKLQELVA